MIRIGLIRERKVPADRRVALSPAQCARILAAYQGASIVVEHSPDRCFTDAEYEAYGIPVSSDLSDCDVLLGIKEVPVDYLMPGKTYCFFSHTKKKQPYNQVMMQAIIHKGIRLIDYECLTHPDEQRILGFGFFAGLVGAHNGLLTYGRKYNAFELKPAHQLGTLKALIASYTHIKLPPVKIVVTGSGKVASGIVEVMDQLDINYIEPEDFLKKSFSYPVYAHLKGHTLYVRKDGAPYHRDDLHHHPEDYQCVFEPYLSKADILMNGVYWDEHVPRLFVADDVQRSDYRMNVIADITCDAHGSVPINEGSSTITDPVYGIDRVTLEKTTPFQPSGQVIDIMAVDNLPNELPRDASEHFGNHFEKYVLSEMLSGDTSGVLERATICSNGRLTPRYDYLSDYAYD